MSQKKSPPDLRLAWLELWKYCKPHTPVLILFLFLITVREGSVIFEKYLFKILVDNSTDFATGAFTKEVFIATLIALGIAFIFATLIQAVSKFAFMHTVNRFEVSLLGSIKTAYFKHIIGLSHRFHTSHKSGSLIARMTRGTRAAERVVDTIMFQFLPLIIQATIALIAIALLSWKYTGIIAVTMIIFIGYSLLIYKWLIPRKAAANEADDYEKAVVADSLANIETVKYFGKEEPVALRHSKAVYNTLKVELTGWDLFRILDFGHTVILGAGALFLVGYGMKDLVFGGVSLGTIVFVFTTYFSLVSPLYNFVRGMRDIAQAGADLASLTQYSAETNEIVDKPNARELTVRKGKIEFNKITFTYNKRKIFDEFTLHVKPGERIALVGLSGAGKSTLIKLLYRLYDLNSGEILIDDIDISTVKQQSLRSALAIVPQEGILFDETVKMNILFGNPQASDAELNRVIKQAQLDAVISKLPKGIDTIVGERGIKLSGGEKQRVAVARALMANKNIIILDEATSSLDSRTEHAIQKALNNLLQGKTSLIIAHRLSTIMHSDRIIVIEDGKIIQEGSHKALVKKKGRYQDLWKLQKGGYIGG